MSYHPSSIKVAELVEDYLSNFSDTHDTEEITQLRAIVMKLRRRQILSDEERQTLQDLVFEDILQTI